MRGYDDQELLRKMATGMMEREYLSVDEAARQVLGEEGGANVDRLRRKFRSENWFEKGLAIHVENEIRRRGLVPKGSAVAERDTLGRAITFLRGKIALGWDIVCPMLEVGVDTGDGADSWKSLRDAVGGKLILTAPLVFLSGFYGLVEETMHRGFAGFIVTLPLPLVGIVFRYFGEKLTDIRWTARTGKAVAG